jgi:NhaP-type Na+/H+ or K+/H+ antiporter
LETFVPSMALVGLVIVVAALFSGLVERSHLPQVGAFLGLGLIVGPAGLGLLAPTLDSPVLRVVATLSLTLVLFTDAITLNLTEVRRAGGLAALVLGPGTLASAGLIALAGAWLLGLPVAAAVLVGAVLASTDPVLVRDVLRLPNAPRLAQQVLRLESGLNDVVVLPIILVAMAFMAQELPRDAAGWARLAINLFLLGPGAGVAVGLLSVATMELVRRRVGVRRVYESIYSLGVALSAFAAAEALHGSGFLAAFAAGLTIAALDVEMCDCFLEYGETTGELALLFTFVLFGATLIWSGLELLSAEVLLFAGIALLVRPPVFLVTLMRSRLDPKARLFTAWFGPRGLSSLLLVLLPVFAGIPGSERLFALCSLVVLLSVLLHGGSMTLLSHRWADAPSAAPAPPQPLVFVGPPAAASPPGTAGRGDDGERLSVERLRALWAAGETVVVADVRRDATYDEATRARGALRLSPDAAARDAARLGVPRDALIVAYCT